MDAKELQGLLISAYETACDCESCSEEADLQIVGIQTYEEVGMLTRDAGFVVTADGKQFQVTIVEV
jgi:hypothetical protein